MTEVLWVTFAGGVMLGSGIGFLAGLGHGLAIAKRYHRNHTTRPESPR